MNKINVIKQVRIRHSHDAIEHAVIQLQPKFPRSTQFDINPEHADKQQYIIVTAHKIATGYKTAQ